MIAVTYPGTRTSTVITGARAASGGSFDSARAVVVLSVVTKTRTTYVVINNTV